MPRIALHCSHEQIPPSDLLAAVTAPYDAVPGRERYAEPAPVDFGDYQTFCGT